MEIKNYLNGIGQYDKTSLEKSGTDAVRNAKDSAATETSKGDAVQFSDEALLRAEAYKTASATSDVRSDKVAALKAQVANGTYQVDGSKIAANLLADETDLFV
jgi:negative regulator of flagellin synthesis FlgM